MIWIGVHPAPFLERMGPSVEEVLELVVGGRAVCGCSRRTAGRCLARTCAPRPDLGL